MLRTALIAGALMLLVAACQPRPEAPAAPRPTPANSSAVTMQPGLPGEPGRVLTAAQADALEHPPHTPADVAFMTGMIAHHDQALEMTVLVADRTASRDIRLLAQRIELSQLEEITLMKTWIRQRGEPVPDEGEHSGHEGMDHGDHGLMPGMLTRAELAALAAARNAEFDRLFLAYMIKHHEGAVVMVAELFASPGGGQQSEIFSFAADVDADQQMEIARMRRMLVDRS